ncbi:hypothetical protein EHM69_09405 [candidate division KSB1 bacterium]|nr:MAG: hypothetical protein EHM69_09405 [candidate division KSB1 bacterium]
MKYTRFLIAAAVLLMLTTAGCYTKFYRPGMESTGQGPYSELYNRYDSTAIDTTLTEDPYVYPETDNSWDRWSYWGRPRGYTRWGFDFNNFSPDYYWSYYGYYDYYGTPWWSNYNNPWWGGSGGGSGAPGEPPSRRPTGRRNPPSSAGSYADPAPSSSPSYAAPNSTPQPAAPKQDDSKSQNTSKGSDDANKRDGKRGR